MYVWLHVVPLKVVKHVCRCVVLRISSLVGFCVFVWAVVWQCRCGILCRDLQGLVGKGFVCVLHSGWDAALSGVVRVSLWLCDL